MSELEGWRELFFDDRQRKEIALDELYAKSFAHGTEGHNARLIIAKFAGLLDDVVRKVQEAKGNHA